MLKVWQWGRWSPRGREIEEFIDWKMEECLWKETKYIDMVPIWDMPTNMSVPNLEAGRDMYYFCLSRIHLFRTEPTLSLGTTFLPLLVHVGQHHTWASGIVMKLGPWEPLFLLVSVIGSSIGTHPSQSQTNAMILLEETEDRYFFFFLLDLGLWGC